MKCCLSSSSGSQLKFNRNVIEFVSGEDVSFTLNFTNEANQIIDITDYEFSGLITSPGLISTDKNLTIDSTTLALEGIATCTISAQVTTQLTAPRYLCSVRTVDNNGNVSYLIDLRLIFEVTQVRAIAL